MSDHTIWLGPVFSGQVSGAVVPGSQLHVIQVHDHAQAAPLLARWHDENDQYLPRMYAELGIAPGDNVFFGSFSAGHNIAKPITRAAADRAMIRALMLADSAQSSWADPQHTLGVPPDGYVAFGVDCVLGQEQLFIASDSSHGEASYASSSATMLSVVDEVAARTLVPFGASPWVPDGLSPTPVGVVGAGGFAALDYGRTISHEAHVLKLAPVLWQNVLVPWLVADHGAGGDGGGGDDENPTETPVASRGRGFGVVLGVLGIIGLGALAYRVGSRSA